MKETDILLYGKNNDENIVNIDIKGNIVYEYIYYSRS